MLNRNSAIIEKYKIGKYPFEENIEIIFSENRNLIIQQIAAWPDEILNLEKLFADQLGAQPASSSSPAYTTSLKLLRYS